MRTIRGGDGLDGIHTHLVVDDLHLLGLADGDGAGVHPQEYAVNDGDFVGLLHNDTAGWEVAEGRGLHEEDLDIADINLWRGYII